MLGGGKEPPSEAARPSATAPTSPPGERGHSLEQVEACEDMLHQWLVTQYHRKESCLNTATLVVCFLPPAEADKGSAESSRIEARFFYDGSLTEQEAGMVEEGGSTRCAALETTAFLASMVEDGTSSGTSAQGLSRRVELVRQRERLVMEREEAIASKYKELKAATLRAEELELHLRQQALDLQTRERILFEQEEDCALRRMAGENDADKTLSAQQHAELMAKMSAAASQQASLEHEIRRLKRERDDLVQRVNEVCAHFSLQSRSLLEMSGGSRDGVSAQHTSLSRPGREILRPNLHEVSEELTTRLEDVEEEMLLQTRTMHDITALLHQERQEREVVEAERDQLKVAMDALVRQASTADGNGEKATCLESSEQRCSTVHDDGPQRSTDVMACSKTSHGCTDCLPSCTSTRTMQRDKSPVRKILPMGHYHSDLGTGTSPQVPDTMSARRPPGIALTDQQQPVDLNLTLGVDPKSTGALGSTQRAAFKIKLTQDLARASGIKTSAFLLKDLADASGGRVCLTVTILPDPAGERASPHEVAGTLKTQSEDPTSRLLAGVVTQHTRAISYSMTEASAAPEHQTQTPPTVGCTGKAGVSEPTPTRSTGKNLDSYGGLWEAAKAERARKLALSFS